MSKEELNKLQQVQDLLKDLGYKNVILEWESNQLHGETHITLTASKTKL